ncbi:YlaH-like family protein [Paenibacillus thermoaerophilus]|uniref:YlaH-like family protein n=1 Tax=Paenibacillus thermoaerophilus TaxID=1215385 RepID=A0ABW2UXM0_9BACL|nr:YlaH-like family protein [Paenibacillus thermoaerophilus]TMV19052.1 hypothetical protein FE781_00635 [Paenibacillus thermoaerophilus]
MNGWLSEHPLLTWILIFILMTYIYNRVFRVRKLPPLKDAVIYLGIGLGALMLLFFQIKVGLPIVPSMLLAVALMLLVKVRYWNEARQKRKEQSRTK